jgi:ribosome maturation factor RimP
LEEHVTTETRAQADRRGADVVKTVRPLAEGVARDQGLVLWGVTWKREAGRDTLAVAVDRRGGIGSDELALVSERLSRAIDESEAVPGEKRYILEVTSPGAERKLRTPEEFDVCVGREARVVTNDGRTVEGPIEAVRERSLDVAGTTVQFDDISKARLVVKF